MTRLCPKCRTPSLHPLSADRAPSLEGALPPPSICEKCRGVWLPHEAIRDGLVPAALHVEDVATPVAADADERAGLCAAGHGIMRRARVDVGAHPLHLDRCGTCLGIWFDAGEWATIAASQWLRHLDDLWDPVFRKRLRDATARDHHLETLRQALGDATFDKVVTVAEALREHPMKSVALAYLLDETRTHAPE
jgi:Zn-finger nucleic acid-binding protein